MKTLFNVLLGLCMVALVWICVGSIVSPIRFEHEQKAREKLVKARLIEIRDAQKEYRKQFNTFTASFDTLIHFVNTAKMPVVAKAGELTDQQLEDGMTERKAMTIINKAKKTDGDKWAQNKEVVKAGLQNFIRDTLWVNVRDTLYSKNFNADSLRYIPFAEGTQFTMEIKNDTMENGTPRNFFVVQAPYTDYLKDMNKQQILNLIDIANKTNRFAGLMVGSLENTIDAGNWE